MSNPTYKPLTAAPYKHNETYTEMLPVNPELAKYIHCYWGSGMPYLQKEEHTVSVGFCGINDTSFCNSADRKCGHLISTFAIRFYAWGAYAFSQDSFAQGHDFCRLYNIGSYGKLSSVRGR